MQRKWQRILFISGDGEAELGFSLIEVLLSIAITILLTNLMIQLCMTLVKQQTFLQEKIALAENAQFAEFILRREIQTAGFCGCNRPNYLDVHYHLSRWYLPIVPIQLFANHTPMMGKQIQPESDVIVIEKMVGNMAAFLEQKKPKIIKTDLKNRFEPGELLIIADCAHADIFVPSAIQHGRSSQIITAEKPLYNHYFRPEIGKLAVTGFFIEKTTRKNHLGQPIKALYSYDFIHHRKTEWISDVAAMEFFYATWDDSENRMVVRPLSQAVNLSTLNLIKIILLFSSKKSGINNDTIFHKKQEISICLRACL